MNIERVRTPEEILADAVVNEGARWRRGESDGTTMSVAHALAIEVAAGELAQALLRRRLSELSAMERRRSVRQPAPDQVREQRRGGDQGAGEHAVGGGIRAESGDLTAG